LKSVKEIRDSKQSNFTERVYAFFRNRVLLAQSLFRLGLLGSEEFQAMIDFFVPDIQIQDTQIPYRAVATDLVSGQSVVMSEGPLRRAVMASCAVPGAVPPVEVNGMLLSDGGAINVVPTMVARGEGADFVVAVSVRGDIHSDDEFGSAADICFRTSDRDSSSSGESALDRIRPCKGSGPGGREGSPRETPPSQKNPAIFQKMGITFIPPEKLHKK
jgi:NTE family protein